MQILIVDDEQLDMFITKKLLGLEFSVEGFTTVSDTLRWAAQNTFDIALIDYYLGPNLYAQDLLKELIALKPPTFKAFVLSNYVDDKQVEVLKSSGFTDVILKPLTLEKFKSFI